MAFGALEQPTAWHGWPRTRASLTASSLRSSCSIGRDQPHEGHRRLAHLLHRHASAVVQVLVLTSLGHLGACTPGHRLHDRIGHTLLPGEVMEAVPDAVHGHWVIDPGQHLHLSPDVVELVVADRPGPCLGREQQSGLDAGGGFAASGSAGASGPTRASEVPARSPGVPSSVGPPG